MRVSFDVINMLLPLKKCWQKNS